MNFAGKHHDIPTAVNFIGFAALSCSRADSSYEQDEISHCKLGGHNVFGKGQP
jgi:hypothetical protein